MNIIPFHLLANQYGFDIQNIDSPDNLVSLFSQLTRLCDLSQQNARSNIEDAGSYVSVVDKIRTAHEELIRFCDTNQITLSDKWRNLEVEVQNQFDQTVEFEEGYSNVVDAIQPFYDTFRLVNLSTQLDDYIFIIKAAFQLYFWYEYWHIGNSIETLFELAQNSGEIQELTQIFCENAEKLKGRAEYISDLFEQFYVKVDIKEKQKLIEKIRCEFLDAEKKEFAQTKQAYDRLELKLRIQLKSTIKKKRIGKIIKWVSIIGVIAAAVGTIFIARKSYRENGRIIQNNAFYRDPVVLCGAGALASGFVGYKAYRFEERQEQFEEILLEQMDQLKDIETKFGIIRKEFKEFQNKSNELAETCQA